MQMPCRLAVNNGANHLHGGKVGFDKVVWSAKESTAADSASVELKYLSKDGEEGYPGNLSTWIRFEIGRASCRERVSSPV